MRAARPVISGQPPNFLLRFLSRAGAISALIFLCASIYACLILTGEIAEKAKIQENALLAGLVDDGWRETAKLQNYLAVLNNLAKKPHSISLLREYIFDACSQMRVEVYRHQFQAIPSSFSRPNSSFGSGENIYAIVRSFRAAPLEAILLVIPMRFSHTESIAVALSFADYAKKQLYWARDIVFLFVDAGSRLALEAWLADYYGYQHPFFLQNRQSGLAAHGGTFISAFGLDLSGSLYDNVQLQYGMVNGKLPNMDLLNLFVLLVEKAGSVPSIHGIAKSRNEYQTGAAAETFWRGIVAKSLNEIEPITAPCGRFGLHAVTLRARPAIQGSSSRHETTIDLVDVVRLVEGGVRSLNNLLEKFHHSYLLYALGHPHRFVSAALYMPLLGMLLTPLLLMALRDWFAFGGASKLATVGSALPVLGLSHLFCLAFYALQSALYADPRLSARAQIAPFSLGLPVLALLIVPLLPFKLDVSSFHFARFVLAIELALFLGGLGLVHFPLALLLCGLLLPLAMACLTLPINCHRLLRAFCFLALNPVSLCLPLLFTQFCADKSPMDCWHKLCARTAAATLAHFAHGSWLLPILSGPVLAISLGFSQILFAAAAAAAASDVDEKASRDEDEEGKEQQKKLD